MADCYEILSVPRDASVAEIRRAYARIARERHPDRFSDPVERERAQEFFMEATAAFNTLSNERSRQEYDAALARPRTTAPEEVAREAHERGLQQFGARAFHEAVELFRSAVYHVPGEARYRAALGMALARNPNWIHEAVQEMEKAVQLEPGSAAFRAHLAEALLGQGLRIRARKAAEAALALDPQEPRAQRVLAETGDDEGEEPPREGGGLLGRLRRKP